MTQVQNREFEVGDRVDFESTTRRRSYANRAPFQIVSRVPTQDGGYVIGIIDRYGRPVLPDAEGLWHPHHFTRVSAVSKS